ncbi:hypothetical protein IE978_29940 [Klebsiella pneumoniae]|uniref:Uncharacterized protein n=1 Tax=Klebsiella pneumoniae TaxID=573 RepID=A0A927DKG4_KLEPN|nr:hypothetical protein [Klebsiella pneumoniae]MBD3723158.1 hypothetical protein [Klebsiella pneumoniae]
MEMINDLLVLVKTSAFVMGLYFSCVYTERTRRDIIRAWFKRNIIVVEKLMTVSGSIEESTFKKDWFNPKDYLKFTIATITILFFIHLTAMAVGIDEGIIILMMIHLWILSMLIIRRYRKQKKNQRKNQKQQRGF